MALHQTISWQKEFFESTIGHLQDGVWLDNVSIEFFLASCLDIMKEIDIRSRAHLENISFFSFMMQEEEDGYLGGFSYDEIKRWICKENRRMKNKSFAEKELILIPVHKRKTHWFLVVLFSPKLSNAENLRESTWTLVIVDPLQNRLCEWKQENVVAPFQQLANLELQTGPPSRRKKRENVTLRVVEQIAGLPPQENDSDCGVFVCRYVAEILEEFASARDSFDCSSLFALLQTAHPGGKGVDRRTSARFLSLSQESMHFYRWEYRQLMERWAREKGQNEQQWETPTMKKHRVEEMRALIEARPPGVAPLQNINSAKRRRQHEATFLTGPGSMRKRKNKGAREMIQSSDETIEETSNNVQ
uniref:Ubiquitin-like protease family profile domain-containing protein n=1 Tax=Chromera velia CCMP2878 TaxID=1169474 RepID=A0A0G4H3F2_9ALVE|eukprot:Cvel_24543.t1-p1 / transcript=Cvel_24543.t1 / gene=Cvel_24543 / organism=Chromera_velia_CCMP2878 / gene_product=hypothetical protein / transcript_product=hypothetical protein / location=Cvel_scaffold2665:21309-23955(+) / protein_length=359 / sequence_SO=supercontig / SO=protein_coding / is_pseudo=false